MANFFRSLFSSSKATPSEEEKAKTEAKHFDTLKYDGIRALGCCGQTAYGIRCLNEALRLREDLETMGYLASAYVKTMQPEKALAVTDRMIACAPERADLRISRIHLLFQLDRDAEVPAECGELLARQPEDPTAYYLRAKAERVMGNQLEAVADLTRALQGKEDFAAAYLLRAELLLAMGQGREALADSEQAVRLAPEEENAYLLRGRIHALLGDNEQARTDFTQVIDLNPFNEEAMVLQGELLTAEGKADEAIRYFDELLDSYPELAKAYAGRGRAKELKGDKTGAFEDLKQAIALDPAGKEAQQMEGRHSNFDDLYKGGIF